jgi:hypothetical protein
VVWYEPAEQIGQRLGTIPVEDFFYNMLCMLMNIGIYERLQRINKPTRQDLAEDPKAQAS